MRIAVNGWRLQGKMTGVGRYLYNILRHWDRELLPPGAEVTVYTSQPVNLALPDGMRRAVLGPDVRLLLWENAVFGPRVAADALFCPSYSRPLLARAPTVVTQHDAVSATHPQFFPPSQRYYNALYGWSARHATRIAADSAASRDDVIRTWRPEPERVRVIQLAPAEHIRPIGDARARLTGYDAPFFFFVGKLSGRRHLPALFEAFAILKRETRLPHQLVLSGLNPHQLDIKGHVERLGIAGDVRFCGFVSDEELNLLYSAADAFVMPSVYETISLPVMEAQAAGTAVVCIDTPGLREITGGHARMIERLDERLLAEAMRGLAESPDERRRLAERGLEHSRRFSWRRCAQETLDLIVEAAGA